MLFRSPGVSHGAPLLGPAPPARGGGSLAPCLASTPSRGREGSRDRREFRAQPRARSPAPAPASPRARTGGRPVLRMRPDTPRSPDPAAASVQSGLVRSAPARASPHPSGLQPHASPRLRPCSRSGRAPTAGPPSGDKACRRRAGAAGWGRTAAASLGPATSRRAAACGRHLGQGAKGLAPEPASRAPSASNAAPAGRGAGLPSASMAGAAPRGQRVPVRHGGGTRGVPVPGPGSDPDRHQCRGAHRVPCLAQSPLVCCRHSFSSLVRVCQTLSWLGSQPGLVVGCLLLLGWVSRKA